MAPIVEYLALRREDFPRKIKKTPKAANATENKPVSKPVSKPVNKHRCDKLDMYFLFNQMFYLEAKRTYKILVSKAKLLLIISNFEENVGTKI